MFEGRFLEAINENGMTICTRVEVYPDIYSISTLHTFYYPTVHVPLVKGLWNEFRCKTVTDTTILDKINSNLFYLLVNLELSALARFIRFFIQFDVDDMNDCIEWIVVSMLNVL